MSSSLNQYKIVKERKVSDHRNYSEEDLIKKSLMRQTWTSDVMGQCNFLVTVHDMREGKCIHIIITALQTNSDVVRIKESVDIHQEKSS